MVPNFRPHRARYPGRAGARRYLWYASVYGTCGAEAAFGGAGAPAGVISFPGGFGFGDSVVWAKGIAEVAPASAPGDLGPDDAAATAAFDEPDF